MDSSLDLDDLDARSSKQKPQDDLSSSGDRRKPPANESLDGGLDNVGRHTRTSRQQVHEDLDGPDMLEILEKDKEPPRRSLSSELDNSIVLGQEDKTWKCMDTVHKAKFSDFSGSMSDSLMGDSFAGSSFASSADSWRELEQNKASEKFTALDDEPGSPPLGSPGPRRMTPKRTYSRQKKVMPKKRDPLMAISEAEHDSLDS